MSNSTQFKAGDRAIVLPALYRPIRGNDMRFSMGHALQVFSIVRVLKFEDGAYECIGQDYEVAQEDDLWQSLFPHQLAPLPIPYHELDQE